MSVCPDITVLEKESQFQQLCQWYPNKSHQWLADALITWRDFYPQHGADAYPKKAQFTRFMNSSLEKARFTTSTKELDSIFSNEEAADAYSSLLQAYTGQQIQDRVAFIYDDFRWEIDNYIEEHPGTTRDKALVELGGVAYLMKRLFDGYHEMTVEDLLTDIYNYSDTDTAEEKERKEGAANHYKDELERMYQNRNRLAMLVLTELKEKEDIVTPYTGVEFNIDEIVRKAEEDKQNKLQALMEDLDRRLAEGSVDEQDALQEYEEAKGDRYIDFRTLKFDETVSVATKRLFNRIEKLDFDGSVVFDDMGIPRHLDFRSTIPVLRRLLLDTEPKDMMDTLMAAETEYPWLKGLLEYLKENTDDQTLIYKDAKRAQQNYITTGVQHDGHTMHDTRPGSSASGKALARLMASSLESGTVPEAEYSLVDDLGKVRIPIESFAKFEEERNNIPDTEGVDPFSKNNRNRTKRIKDFLDAMSSAVKAIDTSVEGNVDWEGFSGDKSDSKHVTTETTILGYTAKRFLLPSSAAAGKKGMEYTLNQLEEEIKILARLCRGIGLKVSAEDIRKAAMTPIHPKSRQYYRFKPNRLAAILDAVTQVYDRAYTLTRDHPLTSDAKYRYIEGGRLVRDTTDEMELLDRALNVTQYDNVEPTAQVGNKSYTTYVPTNLMHDTFDRVFRVLKSIRDKDGNGLESDYDFLRSFCQEYMECEGYTVRGEEGRPREPIGFVKYIYNIVDRHDKYTRYRERLINYGEEDPETVELKNAIDRIDAEQAKFTTKDRNPFQLLDNLSYNEVEYKDMTDAQHQTLSLRRFLNQNAIEIPIPSDYEISEYLQVPLPEGHEAWVDAFTDEVLAEAERVFRLRKLAQDNQGGINPVYESQGMNFYVFPEFNDDKVLDELAKYADDSVKLREALRNKVEELLSEYYVKGMKRLVGSDNFILGNPNFEKSVASKIPASFEVVEYVPEDRSKGTEAHVVYRRAQRDASGKKILDQEGEPIMVEDTSRIFFKDKEGNYRAFREFKPGEGGEANHYMWSFILGTMYGQIQMEKMVMGGRSFFNGLLDKEKRSMMEHGPRESMFTESTWHGEPLKNFDGSEVTEEQKTVQKVLYVKDEKTGSAIQDAIRQHLKEQMDSTQADDYADSYGDNKITATDGIGLRSPESYRRIKIYNKEWTDEDEEAFQKMMRGEATAKDLARFRPHFKPLYSGHEIVEYPDGTKVRVPVLHKYSEMMILPSIMANRGGFQMAAAPLAGLSKAMEENGLDLILFHSGCKVGMSYAVGDLFDTVKDSDGTVRRKYPTADAIRKRISEAIKNEPKSVHKLPWSNFGKTASLPPHVLNTKIAWSSQAYKLARANISAKDLVKLGDHDFSARLGQKMFDQVESAIISFEYERLMNELNDPARVVELLQNELAQKSYSSPEMSWALSQLKDGKMSLPLFWLNTSNSAQQLITSIFRSRLTRHKTKGANYVQTSSLGLDEVQTQFGDNVRKLRVVYNDDEIKSGKESKKRIKYIEAYAALHDDRLLAFADERGFLGPDRIEKLLREGILDPKILECVGYRTPSDAEHSVIPIRIVGFLVNASGADIILPREVMNMTGHDYDGDKLRVHFHDFKMSWNYEKMHDFFMKHFYSSVRTQEENDEAYAKFVKDVKSGKSAYQYRKVEVYSLDYGSMMQGDDIVKNPADLEFSDYNTRIKTYDNAMVDLVFAQLTSPEGSSRVIIPGGAGDSGKLGKIFELLRLIHGVNGSDIKESLAEELSTRFNSKFTANDMQSTIVYTLLKRLPAKEVEGLLDKYSSKMSHYSYNHVMDAFDYMMTGAGMIDGFALYNSAFALLQKMDCHYIPRKYKYKFNGQTRTGTRNVTLFNNTIDQLFQPKTDDQKAYAILCLSHMLNAAVDNGKDPILGYLGQSSNLIPLDFFLAAAGFNEEQVHLIVNQPVVQEIKRIMQEDKIPFGAAIIQVFEEFEEDRTIHKNAEEEAALNQSEEENADEGQSESEQSVNAAGDSEEADEEDPEEDEFFNAAAEDNVQKYVRKGKKTGKNKRKSTRKRLEELSRATETEFTDMLGVSFESVLDPRMNDNVRNFQLNLLTALSQVSGAVTELTKAVTTMRAESSHGSVGPTVAATQAKYAKFQEIVENPFQRISGLSDVYRQLEVNDGDSAQEIMKKLGNSPEPTTTLLYELSMKKCLDFMSRYFPQAGEEFYRRSLELAKEYDVHEVQDTLLKGIQEDMLLFMMMYQPKYAGASFEAVEAKRKDLVLEFPYRYNDFRNRCLNAATNKAQGKEYEEGYAELADNLIVQQLTATFPYSNAKERTRPWLNFNADSLIDSNIVDKTHRAWDELLHSNVKEAREMALSLLDYSIFTNGYSFGKKEFGHYAPFSVVMTDPHFVEALYGIQKSDFSDELWEIFRLMYYLNHADNNEKLVPQIAAGMLPKEIRDAVKKDMKDRFNKSVTITPSKESEVSMAYIARKEVIGVQLGKDKETKKPVIYYYQVIHDDKGFSLKPVQLVGETSEGGRRHRQYNPYADAYALPALHESDRDIYKNGGKDTKDVDGKKVNTAAATKNRALEWQFRGIGGSYQAADAANNPPASKSSRKWAKSASNNYEVSSDGDSRFSALNAKLYDGRTIEEAYQLDVKGYRNLGYTWKQAKADRGVHAPVKMTQEQLYAEYLELWRQWAEENPALIQELREKSEGKVLTDKFAGDNPNSVSQARALAQILDETDVKPSTDIESHISTTQSSDYTVRTKMNADWSDITVAFAVDFSTLGEKATKRDAGNKWMPVLLTDEGGSFDAHDESQYDALLEKMLSNPVKLNIAGNGMQTLSKVTDQDRVDTIVYNYIKGLLDDGAKISEIRSGGQTGVDEAGIKAAIRLGIPWSIIAPAGYKIRDANGRTITDKEAFISRFRDITPDAEESENITPEEAMADNVSPEPSANPSLQQQVQNAALGFLTGRMYSLAERVMDDNGNETIVVSQVAPTPNNIKELRRQRMYVKLNQRLRYLLEQAGVSVGVMDEMDRRLDAVGITDFDKPIVLANGLIEYIRLAHGFAGEMALPEEFSHMSVAMLRGNNLVERLRDVLSNNEAALRSAFGGQYDAYANDPEYRNNKAKLVEEAMGKLVQRQIVEQAEAEFTPIRSLVRRVAEAIKDFFRRMFRISDIQDAVYDSLEISSKLARDLISGRLLDQMDLDNIKAEGKFKQLQQDLSEKTDILSKVVKNEVHRLEIYMKRLGMDQKAIDDSPAIAATRATIESLTDQVWQGKTELALMGYMQEASDRIVEAHKALKDAVNAGLGANEEGKQLNLLRDLINSYAEVAKAIEEAMDDGEIVASDEFRQLFRNMNSTISEYYRDYQKMSNVLLMRMLSNVYGENGVDVALRGKTRHISIKEMATHGDHDINLAQRWFYSIANCDDFVLKAIDDVTRRAKTQARNRTAVSQRDIEVAMADYVRATGSRDSSFIYARDANGRKTGKYITDDEIEALPEAQRKLAKILIKAKYEADKYVPDSYVNAYGGTSSIVMLRKSTLDKVRTADGVGNKGKAIWESVRDSVLETADDFDPETEVVQKDLSGSLADKIPVHYLTKSKSESFDDMTDDAATAILTYIGMANEYDELNNVIGILENARYASMERDIEQGTGRRKQREKVEADGMGYSQVFTVKQATTNIQRIMDDYFRMHLYGHLHHDEGSWNIFGHEVSKSKVASKLNAVTSLSQMAFNFQQRLSNISTGKMQVIIEGAGGRFSVKDIAKADGIYMKYTPDRLWDTGKTESDNKLSLWRERFDVGQNNGEVRNVGYGKKRFGKLFNTNVMFAGLLAGEDYLSTVTSLALSEKFRMKNSEGEECSLFDAFEVAYNDPVNKVGAYLKLKDGMTKLDGTALTEEDEYRFMKQVAGTNFDLQGIYNVDDRCAAQSRALGSLVIMYRKWIAPAIKRRYGRAQYDTLRGEYTQGYWNTTWFAFVDGMTRILKEGEAFRLGALVNWDRLSAMEKSNVRKALVEAGSICGILIALALLDKFQLPDKDDDENRLLTWAEKMGYYQLLRLKNELGSQAPSHLLLAEAKKMLESPFAAFKPLAATFDAWNLFLPSNYVTTVRSGAYKGHSRAYKYFWSLPILSMRKQFRNLLDPSSLINFYKNPQI